MYAISQENYAESFVYDICTGTVANAPVKARLIRVRDEIARKGAAFIRAASNGSLNTLPPLVAKKNDVVISDVTRKNLTDLYESEMLLVSKEARLIYDDIKASAPLGICPTCGIGVVSTVDHFLPKAKFPWYSVLPENLLPSCKDCNLDKKAEHYVDAQNYHPYYDKQYLESDRWLFAELRKGSPPTVVFKVVSPNNWSQPELDRAIGHFSGYRLKLRFGVLAASEMTKVLNVVTKPMLQTNQVRAHLQAMIKGEGDECFNSWKRAMYEALLGADWFCDLELEKIGYKVPAASPKIGDPIN